MKLIRHLLPLALVACGLSATAFAAEQSSRDDITNRDFDTINEFVKTKRAMTTAEKANNLTISGDVRFEYENSKEKHDGERHRGKGAERSAFWFDGHQVPTNEFDVQLNLILDYRTECAWAVAHLKFDNDAGVDDDHDCCEEDRTACINGAPVTHTRAGDREGYHGSGGEDNLSLFKAYMGYNILEECASRLDIELGRRKFYHVFDSRVQFNSRFDGVLLKYSNSFECVADFYINVGAFVVDEVVNHFGYVGEMGFLNIADWGLDVKYSLIDWRKKGCNHCDWSDARGMKFVNSQFTMAYNFCPEIMRTKAQVYGAVIFNHAAKKISETDNKKEALAWYVGFLIGEIKREGDWYVDLNYQYVQAQSVMGRDMGGIGRGNVHDLSFTQTNTAGNVNYKGFRFEGAYALTDNLTINPAWEMSKEAKSAIGGKHRYTQFELRFIYAF